MPRFILAAIILGCAVLPAISQPANAQSGQQERAWCVNKVTRLSSTPEGQMRNTYGNEACVLNGGPAARAFLDLNYGGTGKICRCM